MNLLQFFILSNFIIFPYDDEKKKKKRTIGFVYLGEFKLWTSLKKTLKMLNNMLLTKIDKI